jgi:hypothetical protein
VDGLQFTEEVIPVTLILDLATRIFCQCEVFRSSFFISGEMAGSCHCFICECKVEILQVIIQCHFQAALGVVQAWFNPLQQGIDPADLPLAPGDIHRFAGDFPVVSGSMCSVLSSVIY